MKKFLIFLLGIIFLIPVRAQFLKSGLLIDMGTGSIIGHINPDVNRNTTSTIVAVSPSYKCAFSLGYRFRLQPKLSKIFYDVDAVVGVKVWHSTDYIEYINTENGQIGTGSAESTTVDSHVTLRGLVNYHLYDKLSAGIGIEPTYIIRKELLDLPVTVKISYDWLRFGIALAYKHGLLKGANNISTLGKFREWQLSLFIPF